jgi:biopolymer transport protein ExbB/TolQ
MDFVLNFLIEYKIVDIGIALVGLYGFFIIYDRYRALFFEYTLPVEPFMQQVMKLVHEDQVEQAITFCAANEKKPLAYVIKRILERSDRDEKSIEHSLDIASSEIAPKIVKRLEKLAMISNVVTLIGLFGTVIGLIVAFKAISFADVAQKQTILAQGISIAMTATAMGLMVAIPIMFIYSFLHEKQGQLFAEIDQHANKVMELIRDRSYVPFTNDAAFPRAHNIDAMMNQGKKIPVAKSS